MAKINRTEITQKAIKDLRLDAARERVPTEASDKIVLTYPLNFKYVNFASSGSLNNSTSTTTFTTDANKDFYLTSITFGYQKDVTATSTFFKIGVTLAEQSSEIDIVRLSAETLTAAKDNQVLQFSTPLKLARGSAVTLRSATAVANFTVLATFQGYYID